MKIYIPYFSAPYEGCTPPLGCFKSEELMWAFLVEEYGERILENASLCFEEYDVNVD